MSNIKIFLAFLYLSALLSPIGYATTFDSHYIENFAKNYLTEQLSTPSDGKMTIKISSIDPRIKIKACNSPLKANIPENYTGRNVNIKISCTDSKPWHIYLMAKIKKTVPVLVAKQAIDKGTILDDATVSLIFLDTGKIRGEILDKTEAVYGAKAKKKITKGQAITRRNICMVCKGDRVSIIAMSSNFTIKTVGIALTSGSIGDHIKIRNKQSGKTITAQVNAINKVLINL